MDAKRTLALLFAVCVTFLTIAVIYFEQLGARAFWTPVAYPLVARRYPGPIDIVEAIEHYKSSINYTMFDELTTVTAYFNIGEFPKSSWSNKFSPELYKSWLRVFGQIESPVVGFFDTDEYLELFLVYRKHLPSNLTVAYKVNRNEMWSFGLVPEIARIFEKPDYPKHLPNTVVPTYSAAMHAKYEVLQWAIERNPFRTRYFCWLDVGLFRSLPRNSPRFAMYLPPKFNTNSVAYQEVYGPRIASAKIEDIIKGNMFWVCGCFFLAEATVMYRWTLEYKVAVYRMIEEHHLMSTDQQVIYAAFNTMNPKTTIQTYTADGRYNEWFHLGYLSRDAGIKRREACWSTLGRTGCVHPAP